MTSAHGSRRGRSAGGSALDSLRLLASGVDHPECVAAGPDGCLYAGGEAGQLYRIDENGEISELASAGAFIAGVCLDGSGRLYACVLGDRRIVRLESDGVIADYGWLPPGASLVEPNFPAFDRAGNLYVTDSGTFGRQTGRIWRIGPDRRATVFDDRVRDYPNGLALDAGGRWLWVVESGSARIVRIEILSSGMAGIVQEMARLRRTVPDGIAFDLAGNLYVACYRPDRIYRVDVEGRATLYLDDWRGISLRAPTNLAFCGPGLRCLAIASLGGREIRGLDVLDPGLPLAYPELR